MPVGDWKPPAGWTWSDCGGWLPPSCECTTVAGIKIFADDTVPLGMMKIVYPDGRVEMIHTNYP